jgi:hypothetical protein
MLKPKDIMEKMHGADETNPFAKQEITRSLWMLAERQQYPLLEILISDVFVLK